MNIDKNKRNIWFQIVFEASVGGDRGDIAIDEVRLLTADCSKYFVL